MSQWLLIMSVHCTLIASSLNRQCGLNHLGNKSSDRLFWLFERRQNAFLCIWFVMCPDADVDQCSTVVWLSCTFVCVLHILCDCLGLWFSQNRLASVIFVQVQYFRFCNHDSAQTSEWVSEYIVFLSRSVSFVSTREKWVHVCRSAHIVVSSIMTPVAVHKRNKIFFTRVKELKEMQLIKYWLYQNQCPSRYSFITGKTIRLLSVCT